MKTVKEYIDAMPEPHRTRALQYVSNAIGNVLVGSHAAAITWVPAWDETGEGYYYFNALCVQDYDRANEILAEREPNGNAAILQWIDDNVSSMVRTVDNDGRDIIRISFMVGLRTFTIESRQPIADIVRFAMKGYSHD